MLSNITLGGYFIVVPTTRSKYMDQTLIPEKFISISDCICDVLPGSWGLSWVSNRKEDIKRAKTLINVSDNKFLELEKWVDEDFNKGNFGWQHGFTNLQSAKEFADKYLYNL